LTSIPRKGPPPQGWFREDSGFQGKDQHKSMAWNYTRERTVCSRSEGGGELKAAREKKEGGWGRGGEHPCRKDDHFS